jgi:hypothetical protein
MSGNEDGAILGDGNSDPGFEHDPDYPEHLAYARWQRRIDSMSTEEEVTEALPELLEEYRRYRAPMEYILTRLIQRELLSDAAIATVIEALPEDSHARRQAPVLRLIRSSAPWEELFERVRELRADWALYRMILKLGSSDLPRARELVESNPRSRRGLRHAIEVREAQLEEMQREG